MHITLKNISTNFLEVMIKNFLYSIGLNEKYISFEYLTWMLIYLIQIDDCDFTKYKQSVLLLVEKFDVSSRTINQALHKIITTCDNEQIVNFSQFKSKTKTAHKILVLKIFAENYLTQHLSNY